MSSIIMHLYISHKVGQDLNLSNKFSAGAVLPDLIKIKTKKRDETHYVEASKNAPKRLPNLERFLEENKSKLNDEVILGYYAHLIEDKIWFDKYIEKFAKKSDGDSVLYLTDKSIHNGKEFTKDIYSDYGIVDDFLINKNNFDLDEIGLVIKDELKDYDLDILIDENITRPSNLSKDGIKFITPELLNRYIEDSVNEVKKEVMKIIGE